MACRITTNSSDQIWVAKLSSYVIQNFRTFALAGRKRCYHKYQDTPLPQKRLEIFEPYFVCGRRTPFYAAFFLHISTSIKIQHCGGHHLECFFIIQAISPNGIRYQADPYVIRLKITRECAIGISLILLPFYGVMSPKPQYWGRE